MRSRAGCATRGGQARTNPNEKCSRGPSPAAARTCAAPTALSGQRQGFPAAAERSIEEDQIKGHRRPGGDQAVLLPDQRLLGGEHPGVIRRPLAVLEVGQLDRAGGRSDTICYAVSLFFSSLSVLLFALRLRLCDVLDERDASLWSQTVRAEPGRSTNDLFFF